jgi:hypothetical protein
MAMPVGEANHENIRFAKDITGRIPVILYAPACALSDPDYTCGEAAAVYEWLRERAITACSLEELLDRLAAVTA